MQKRAINPTPWLLGFNMNHAIEVKGGERTLYLSGQTASAADASPLHPGNLVAQFQVAWDNLKAALAESEMQPENVVRMNIYTTDVALFMEEAEKIIPIFAADGVKPVCTLLGISALYDPDLMVEIEATAVA
ncbi:MAG: RidA family protein [Pseudomonadota bacterium]